VRRRPGKELEHMKLVARRIDALKAAAEEGGPREAAIRALIYIGMPDGAVDERAFAVVRKMREEHGDDLTLPEFKAVIRRQFLTLLLDQERAVAAIPGMVARDGDAAQKILPALRPVIAARGTLGQESRKRLEQVETMLTEATTPIRPKGIAIPDKSRAGKGPAKPAEKVSPS
jgi:hypothetical protein